MTYDNQGRRIWTDHEFAEPCADLPEGREPIKWSELKGYPSDALAEAKALYIAASNALHKLEQSRFSNAEHEQAKDILRKATTAPHSATPQREVERK